jgi:hypothetical protein
MFFPKPYETKLEHEVALMRTALARKEELWTPYTWRKANFIFTAIAMAMLMTFEVELGYSAPYAANYYLCLVLIRVFSFIIEKIVEYQLQDALLCMPIFAGMSFTEGLIGFGSPDYMAFLLGFFMDNIFCIVERLYQEEITGMIYSSIESLMELIMQIVLKFTPKWVKNYFGIIEETEEEKLKKPKREVEGVAATGEDNESVEPIIGLFSGITITIAITIIIKIIYHLYHKALPVTVI